MPMSKIFYHMTLASPAIIFYLTLLTKYSQETKVTIDLFDRGPNQTHNDFDTAITSLDPLVLSRTPEKNWLSLGLSSSGDQPKPNTVEKSKEINFSSSTGKGELSYLGRDLIESQKSKEQNNSGTFRHSEHKKHAIEFSSLTRPQWPARSEENELLHIDAEPRSDDQSTQTKPNRPALPRVNFRLGNPAGPSTIEAELTAHKPSKSGTINGFNEFTRHRILQSGEIHSLFHNYDPKTFYSGNYFRNEMYFGHPSAFNDKYPLWTEYTSIMPLERMDGQKFQKVNYKPGSPNGFEKVNSELSLAPKFHQSNPMYTFGDTGQVLNSEVGGAIKSFEINQRKGKRKKSIAQEASAEKLSKGKKARKISYDKEISESAFRYDKNNGEAVITSPEIIAFKDALMELVDLEKPLIQSDLFDIYLFKIEMLKNDEIKNSAKNVLNLINKRYSKYEREYFYITDSEVINFLNVKRNEGFKLNPHPRDKYATQNFERNFFQEIRRLIEAVNFENLTKHLNEVYGDEYFLNPKENQLSKFHFRRDSYIKKLFLVYSILINKIFCGKSQDESFINRHKSSIEFCGSVFRNIKSDKDGNYYIDIDMFQNIDESLRKTVDLDKKIISFNKSMVYVTQNQERIQSRVAWILIELWLGFCRPQLYNQLADNLFCRRFQPFLNTFIKIVWQISKKL